MLFHVVGLVFERSKVVEDEFHIYLCQESERTGGWNLEGKMWLYRLLLMCIYVNLDFLPCLLLLLVHLNKLEMVAKDLHNTTVDAILL